jgi:hypothetical protein
MREILFATDLVPDFPTAAPYAVSLAQENQAHLVLLHVIEDAKAGDGRPRWLNHTTQGLPTPHTRI